MAVTAVLRPGVIPGGKPSKLTNGETEAPFVPKTLYLISVIGELLQSSWLSVPASFKINWDSGLWVKNPLIVVGVHVEPPVVIV